MGLQVGAVSDRADQGLADHVLIVEGDQHFGEGNPVAILRDSPENPKWRTRRGHEMRIVW